MSEGGDAKAASTVVDKERKLLDTQFLNLLQGLEKSSLCEEDVYRHGHHSAWGSWYDVKAGSWGYACCHCVTREDPCTKPLHDASQKKRSKVFLPDDRAFDWGKPPLELLPREKVILTASLLNSRVDHQGCFIAHFVRYMLGTWRRMLGGQMSGAGIAQDWFCPSCGELNFARKLQCRKCGAAHPNPPAELADTGLSPHVVEVHRTTQFKACDHFTHREEAGARHRKVPAIANVMPSEFPEDLKGVQSCEETERGFAPLMRQLQANKANQKFVEHLDKVISLAAEQDYVEAGKAYKELCVSKITGSMHFDDATTQRVWQSVQKLVRLAEVMFPPADSANKFTT